MTCGVLVPEGKIAMGKLSQAIAHGATLLQVDGNFDDCLDPGPQARRGLPGRAGQLGQPGPHRGPEDRGVRGRRRARRRPRHPLPAGRQRRQHHGLLAGLPRVLPPTRRCPAAPPGCRGCGASRPRGRRRSCSGHPVDHPETIATAIRIGNPASWTQAEAGARRVRRHASRPSPTSRSWPRTGCCRSREGVFVEPGVGGQRRRPARGRARRGWCRRAHASSAPSPATGSRTRSGRCGPPTGARSPDPGARRRVHRGRGPRARGLTVVRPGPRAGTGVLGCACPASSANLGPGFDSIGLALGLWDDLRRVADRRPGAGDRGRGGGRRRRARRRAAPGPPHDAARLGRARRAPARGHPHGLPQQRAARAWAGLLGGRHRRGRRCGTRRFTTRVRHGPAHDVAGFDRCFTNDLASASRATPTTPRPASTAA